MVSSYVYQGRVGDEIFWDIEPIYQLITDVELLSWKTTSDKDHLEVCQEVDFYLGLL